MTSLPTSVPHALLLLPATQLDSSGAPNTATAEEVDAAAVQLGQHVMVRPGEQVGARSRGQGSWGPGAILQPDV